MIRPDVELLYEAFAELGPLVPIGETAEGLRRYIPILGGTFEGPTMRGEIVGGGADWQLMRSDGVLLLDAIYAIRTDDGINIQVRNRGLRHAAPEVMEAMARGEEVDPASVYFRSVPEFVAPTGRYEGLNRAIFLGTGQRHPSAIRLWIWKVI